MKTSEELVSINKLREDIRAMKVLGIFLPSESRKEMKRIENELNEVIVQSDLFNARFTDSGWCAYDHMSFELIKSANAAFDCGGIDAAESVLVEYYKTDIKKMMHWLRHNPPELSIRYHLIEKALNEHMCSNYTASVPLLLISIDGAVNDFTSRRGFFADGTDVTAWDCLVGCSNGLTKLKAIFNKGRNVTTSEVITMPYRNGILHGRDLNYANEYVSCKCVALLFAIADWMKMILNEDTRKEEFEKKSNPPSFREIYAKLQKNKENRKMIDDWKPRSIDVGVDIPAFGDSTEYRDYAFVETVVLMFEAWNQKNYGQLALFLKKYVSY